MAADPRILIPGGYGVFGRLLARELRGRNDARLVIAGRSPARAAAVCAELGDRAVPMVLDLADLDAFATTARGCAAVACCAGPFQDLPLGLPAAAVGAGAHWLDMADDPGWVTAVLSDAATGERARARGLAIAPGVSSIPFLAMVLLRWCVERLPGADRARVALFIGNRNSKGAGSIASALAGGFHDPSPFDHPAGRRPAYRFASALEPLCREALGIEVELRVTLGSGAAGRIVQLASSLGGRRGLRRPTARALALVARPLRAFGRSGGSVVVEAGDGRSSLTTALVGPDQRFAIVPLALAIEELLAGREIAGTVDASAWLSPARWLELLCARGLRFLVRRGG